jgi:hypothetical protein
MWLHFEYTFVPILFKYMLGMIMPWKILVGIACKLDFMWKVAMKRIV